MLSLHLKIHIVDICFLDSNRKKSPICKTAPSRAKVEKTMGNACLKELMELIEHDAKEFIFFTLLAQFYFRSTRKWEAMLIDWVALLNQYKINLIIIKLKLSKANDIIPIFFRFDWRTWNCYSKNGVSPCRWSSVVNTTRYLSTERDVKHFIRVPILTNCRK